MNVDYEWQRPYVAGVLEANRSKLSQLIEEADTAIQTRIQELNQDHLGTREKRLAIEFALNCLKLLDKEKEIVDS